LQVVDLEGALWTSSRPIYRPPSCSEDPPVLSADNRLVEAWNRALPDGAVERHLPVSGTGGQQPQNDLTSASVKPGWCCHAFLALWNRADANRAPAPRCTTTTTSTSSSSSPSAAQRSSRNAIFIACMSPVIKTAPDDGRTRRRRLYSIFRVLICAKYTRPNTKYCA
jgi:hypothetical protein